MDLILNTILDVLLKWFAPILVFTTEEIYSLMNKDNSESIHENYFVKFTGKWLHGMIFQAIIYQYAIKGKAKKKLNVIVKEEEMGIKTI